ncbi:MAG: HAD family phosphatase [Armatimonadetes bacterium]|nr:HAD family phosphatase [Armatimonadota bacterium]
MTDSTSLARPFKLVALDLDGTLLNAQGEVSAADAEALRGFAEAGGVVVLASGRMTDNIRPFYESIGIDGPTIAYNGALTRQSAAEGAAVILETPLPARYADEIVAYTEREHFHLNYYLDEKLYAREDSSLRRFANLYSGQTGAVFHFLPDLHRFRGCGPTKLIIVTDPTVPDQPDPRHRDELYAVWKQRWGDEVTVMRTNPEYLEFYHCEAGKGRALLAVADRYGIDHSLTLAFGDNFNDVSMLQAAGCGVAVGNANAEAKAVADWVSTLTNDEHAVADAMERLVCPET